MLLLFLSACAIKPIDQASVMAPSEKNNLSSVIAVEFLKQDVDQLVKMVESIHPEPFSLVSRAEFSQKVQEIKQSLRYPLSRSEFYIRIAPLLAILRDIHSQVKLPKYVPGHYQTDKTLFPLAVLYEQQGLMVAADLSDRSQIPSGAQIISVNGASVSFLLNLMQKMTAFETDSGLRRRIQVDFPWLLWSLGYASAHYQIEYLWESQRYLVEVEGIEPVVPPSKKPASSAEGEAKLDTFSISSLADKRPVTSFYGASQVEDNTRLLWFNDFREEPQVFSHFLQQEFKTMQNKAIDNLIIDVRYNDGGRLQNIKTLLSYISKQPLYWSQKGELHISSALKKLHQQATKQRRKSKYRWGLQWLPLEWTDALQYKISWGDVGENVSVEFDIIDPRENYKPVTIILLINGFCYSACSSFVATANYYSLAPTIGEISGNFARVQYAYPIKNKLKNSQLEVMLPTMKLLFLASDGDRAMSMDEATSLVKPQIPLQRQQQDMMDHRDIVLMKALEMIHHSMIGKDL